MWIARARWTTLERTLSAMYAHIQTLDRRDDEMRRTAIQREEYICAIELQLRGRDQTHLDALIEKATALTASDHHRIEINRLRSENAALLKKLVGIEFDVPRIESGDVVVVPGMSFDDMGDAAAKMHGLSSEIPVETVGLGVPKRPAPPAGMAIDESALLRDPAEVD